ncbi:MAG: hypothetical protein ACKV22_16040 [Bryobacteraceae bacterium]
MSNFDLNSLRAFAGNEFNLTGPLAHDEVHTLAVEWMPEIRFHEKENFHSISYAELLGLRDSGDANIVWLKTVSATNPEIPSREKPPVLFESEEHKVALDPAGASISSTSYISNVHDPEDPVSDFDRLDRDPWDLAKFYFGSRNISNGVKLPRIDPVTATAEYRDLRSYFKLRAQAESDGNLPADQYGILDAVLGPVMFNLAEPEDAGRRAAQLQRLIDLVDFADQADRHESGAERREAAVLSELVADKVITRGQWTVLRNFGLLEYFFVFAYNDMGEHHKEQPWIRLFDHEGDVEGFGVMFDRKDVAQVDQEQDRLDYLLHKLRPKYFLSSAHGHWQGLDQYREPGHPQEGLPSCRGVDDPQLTLEEIKNSLTVWVMAGSHATYLCPGEYQNFDSVDEVVKGGSPLAAMLAFPAYAVPVAIVTSLLEHFLEPEEETSDNGVHTVPPRLAGQPGTGPAPVASRVLTTPLSKDRNIYQESWWHRDGLELDITFAERVFPGTWGFGPALSFSKATLFATILAEQVFGE